MEDEYSDELYSKQDIYQAFDMGLEWAIHVFEKAVNFSPEGRKQLIEGLKKALSEEKNYDKKPKRTLRLVKS